EGRLDRGRRPGPDARGAVAIQSSVLGLPEPDPHLPQRWIRATTADPSDWAAGRQRPALLEWLTAGQRGGQTARLLIRQEDLSMKPTYLILPILLAVTQQASQGQEPAKPKLYNTVKQKLLEGKQVFSFTQTKMDIDGYCEAAKHYDYTWFEMQHSTLEFKDIEAMIAACPHTAAIPMIRLPDAQEWHIQHATDIGVLGVIIPTVDDVDRAREAAKWSRYPPVARRSSGMGQARAIWGIDGINYAKTINDNMLVVVMLETPTAVANAFDIASVPGIDVVIVGNNDLSQFSGYAQTDDRYQQMVTKIHDDT